jgi:hypothetical protein
MFAFREVSRRFKFRPTPSEILDIVAESPERVAGHVAEADQECKVCDGTGFKMAERPDGVGKWAIACECRKKRSA